MDGAAVVTFAFLPAALGAGCGEKNFWIWWKTAGENGPARVESATVFNGREMNVQCQCKVEKQ